MVDKSIDVTIMMLVVIWFISLVVLCLSTLP
jgi:hypothetical protein